jgi:predicted DNA-binding transcriptional regulator AlpA
MTPLWTRQNVADHLVVSTRTVDRMWRRGDIPRPDIRTPRTVRWRPETIYKWETQQSKIEQVDSCRQL